MNESLIQQYYVSEEDVKNKNYSSLSFFIVKFNKLFFILENIKFVKVPANSRASSRGNTRGASVIRINWAYRVRRLFN